MTYAVKDKKQERMRLMNDRSVGYLTVRVTTARGAIPLEGATVNIRGDGEDSSALLYSLLSDNSGMTPKVSLSTPPNENSQTPLGAAAYSTYNIDVFKEGYIPLYFHKVPVFPNIISVQPAVMVPVKGQTGIVQAKSITEYPKSTLE